MSRGILIKTTKGTRGCDSREIPALSIVCRLHHRPSRLGQVKKKDRRIAAIQRTGLYFEGGEPNESLGLGSPGHLAGGNEMKQSRAGKKQKTQNGRVGTSHLG